MRYAIFRAPTNEEDDLQDDAFKNVIVEENALTEDCLELFREIGQIVRNNVTLAHNAYAPLYGRVENLQRGDRSPYEWAEDVDWVEFFEGCGIPSYIPFKEWKWDRYDDPYRTSDSMPVEAIWNREETLAKLEEQLESHTISWKKREQERLLREREIKLKELATLEQQLFPNGRGSE